MEDRLTGITTIQNDLPLTTTWNVSLFLGTMIYIRGHSHFQTR